MKMAFILFDGMTTLDFSGFHNAVTWLKKLNRLENLSWEYCSNKEEIVDDRNMGIRIDRVLPDLSGYDLIFIPGGMAARQLAHDETFVAWIRTAKAVKYKVSVCTGALLLGAADLLREKKITTNPLALELLKPYCREVVRTRFMRDGDVFTGGGITSSVDLGLFFIENIAGKTAAIEVRERMDYPYCTIEEDIGNPQQSVYGRLGALGISLPKATEPAARYANYVRTGNLLFVAGKGPGGNPRGKLGERFNTEEGYAYARQTGIEILAVLESAAGSLEKVTRVVKLQGFVNAAPDFGEHHKVMNGCSDLMLEVFGDRGVHARSVFGATSVRDHLPVIIDSIFEIED